uniref:Uncharacterized protein n=1 Tax=Trichuris muris TaxID=70415 RepID=A0A5S6R4U4_TRIMR
MGLRLRSASPLKLPPSDNLPRHSGAYSKLPLCVGKSNLRLPPATQLLQYERLPACSRTLQRRRVHALSRSFKPLLGFEWSLPIRNYRRAPKGLPAARHLSPLQLDLAENL